MAQKKTEKKEVFVNPFEKGVTYEFFLKSLGKSNLDDYMKNFECSKDQLEWLKTELTEFKKNN